MISNNKLLLCLGLVFAFGCKGGSEMQDAKLDEILNRLAQLDAKISQLGGGGGNQGPPMPKPGVAYQIPVHPDDAYRGGQHAKVTIVEAFEFACPYCALMAPTMDEIVKSYKPDEVKLVNKHLIIHPDVATNAAFASCAAHKQGKFSEFEKALWHEAWGDDLNQPNFKQGSLSPENLSKLAGKLKLDVKKFEEDMKTACREVVGRNVQELGKAGVMATPSIFINGVAYMGSRQLDGFKEVIDAEIKKADEAISAGTKLEDYYASIQKTAKPKIE